MIQIIGWTILHSLWQIALLASLYLLIKNNWRTKTALKKYYLAVSTLVATFLSTIFTFSYLYQQGNWMVTPVTNSSLSPIVSETLTTKLIPIQPNEIAVETTMTLVDYLTICLPYLVAFWGLGMLYFTIRFLKNLYGVKQLQNIDNELISGEWLAKIKTFKTQLNIQKDVQVFLSLHVKEPITFGHFKPIILLPISLITGFDSAAIETIILHELVHIKRHDYLVNLGQSIIEIILFYHPLIWWLSKDIRELREHCCDDLVLSLGDNRITYVETLTALQWRKVGGVTNRLSLSASGGDAGFSRRIKRMFGVEEERGSFRQLMAVSLVLLLLAVGAFTYQKYYKPVIATDDISEMPYPDKELNKPGEFSFIISNDRNKEALFTDLRDFQKKTGTDFTFDWIGFHRNNGLTGSIGGTIAYKDNWQSVHSFEVQDLEKYSLLFTGNADQIYPPQYIENSTQQIISAKPITKSKKATLLVNAKTTKADLERWAKSVLDYGVIFYHKKSIFDTNDNLIGLNGKFIGEQGYFEEFYYSLKDVDLKLEVEDNFIYQPTIISKIGENSANGKQLENLTLYDGMDLQNLFKTIHDFNNKADVRINFYNLGDNNGKLAGEIRGTIRPNKSGIYHFFEIHDLSKYSIVLQANSDTILLPKYIASGTNEVITTVENNTGKNSKIKINSQTSKADLVNWANSITKHGIVFNFEKSIFDKEEKLLGLNAKFNGECCFNDAFFISNLDEVEVHLEVKDNYIYQPTVITQTEDGVEELKARFWSEAIERAWINPEKDDELWKMESLRKMKIISNGKDISPSLLIPNLQEEAKYKNWLNTTSKKSKENRFKQIKQEYEIGLLESKKGKERAVWEQKLEELAKIKQHSNVILNNQFKSKTTETPSLSYKISNWKALDLDSSAYGLKKRYENRRGNNIAQLIPPYVAVDDSVRAMNPIYRVNTEKAKSVFVNGQKVAKKDLPAFMEKNLQETINKENQFQETIKGTIPKRKRYPKTDTTVDWLYWGDQKINLGEAYKKEENGDLKWDAPKLKISKEVWENNKDRPFIFQIDGDWFRVKDLDMAVLVPYKGDPASANFYKDYAKALRNKAGSVLRW